MPEKMLVNFNASCEIVHRVPTKNNTDILTHRDKRVSNVSFLVTAHSNTHNNRALLTLTNYKQSATDAKCG